MKAGDVVRLKSGGPVMTVEVVENGSAECVYFVDTGAAAIAGHERWDGPYRPSFLLDVLEKVAEQ